MAKRLWKKGRYGFTCCVVGNIMSGLALMSVGNLLFAATVLLANWATTYFYLMGGSLFNR